MQIIIVFIYSWLVSMVAQLSNERESHATSWYMVAMDFFIALNFYDFFNQYCSNSLKKPTLRGLSITIFLIHPQIKEIWIMNYVCFSHSSLCVHDNLLIVAFYQNAIIELF